MISGAAQLKCGISCYQWLVVVYLAWFSSLTHLSCLTLLRNYLHNRPAERTWRLVCMFVLVALLFFAFLPTVNYRWQLGRSAEGAGPPTPEDYAICYLKPMSRLDYDAHSMYWEGLNYHSHSEHTIVATSISIVLLFVGFVCRVFKLHQSFSKFLDHSIRRRISRSLRIPLRVVCDWCDVQGSPRSLKRYLLYRPLLALFLTARVSADTWNSMFFEVSFSPKSC
jgi:hypothetical protein